MNRGGTLKLGERPEKMVRAFFLSSNSYLHTEGLYRLRLNAISRSEDFVNMIMDFFYKDSRFLPGGGTLPDKDLPGADDARKMQGYETPAVLKQSRH